MKGKARRLDKWVPFLSTGAAFAVWATAAHAADPVAPSHAPPPPVAMQTETMARERASTRSFYGWQILATGEAGGAVAAASMVLPDSPLNTVPATVGFLIGMPFYALGGPATHWTHGDFSKGLVSLGGTFVLPVLSGLVGQGIRCAPSDAPGDCGTSGFIGGFAIALVTVPLVDALVLGWEDLPDDESVVTGDAARAGDSAPRLPRRSREARAPQFTLTPAWSIGPKRELAFGVAGRF